jgi:hypothetical protein
MESKMYRGEGDVSAHSGGKEIEEMLDEKYLAADGEQKVYVLPEGFDVDQLVSNLTGGRTGESKQSQMWRKTDVGLEEKGVDGLLGKMTTHVQGIDKRLRRIEMLLQQTTVTDLRDEK